MRACELVELLGAGEVVGGIIDVNHAGYKPTEITLDPQWINGFIGIDVSRDKMISILERLGCMHERRHDYCSLFPQRPGA